MKKCFVAGDSAGGNIAHHVTLRASENFNKFKEIKIIGLLGLQPFFGGEERVESELRLTKAPILNVESTDWMWKCFLPEGADRNHHAARVFGDGRSLQATKKLKSIGFPKTLVVVGGHDPLQDWQKKYVDWLENCGKEVEVLEYPNTFHGFYGFPELGEYDLLAKDVMKFIQKQAHNV